MEFDLRNVSATNMKKQKKACISFKSIIFYQRTYFAFTLVQWQNSDQEKKVIFKVFFF